MTREAPLRRQLGLAAVLAVVAGDMLGSGIFFTPGELAPVAQAPWHVYFLWGLCGVITLCGALTLAELSVLLPRAGASYHIIREGFGPFWAFVKIWIELWISGPASVAGVAILFGEFLVGLVGPDSALPPAAWGAVAIAGFAAINLLGIEWGGRTQIALTAIKLVGLCALVVGALFLAPSAPAVAETGAGAGGMLGFVSLVGLGVATVLFTYDGWVDVTHVAGEIREPRRILPLALGLGVGGITLLYLAVNHAYLRVVGLPAMREAPATVAARVAEASFGSGGGRLLSVLITISILGALGGLVMTLPRLYYGAASRYAGPDSGTRSIALFRALAWVSPRRSVPAGSILSCAALAITALLFFGTFRRIVTYMVVPLHLMNMLMVASVFRLRRRADLGPADYRTPGYPVVPAVFLVVIFLFLLGAVVYDPRVTLIGIGMTATAIPAYFWINRRTAA
jgi:basic amino acid/polyamine antiporter, APA family